MHHVSLTVTDLARSRAWYEALFDLELVMEEPSSPTRNRSGAVYRFAGSRLMLGLVQHQITDGGAFDPTTTGLDHVAFDAPTRAVIDAWAERLDALGIVHSGVIDVPLGAILNWKDPDGIALAFYWER